MKKIKVFISCAHNDKVVAEDIKVNLEKNFGFDVFLFSQDILLSQEWAPHIIGALVESDYFIPLISQNYQVSAFANQEAGISFFLKKKIIPLSLDSTKPCGFLGIYNADPFDINNRFAPEKAAIAIFLIAFRDERYKKYRARLRNSIIDALQRSDDFQITNTIIRVLINIDGFSNAQISRIIKAIKNNRCVREERFMLPALIEYLKSKYNFTV